MSGQIAGEEINRLRASLPKSPEHCANISASLKGKKRLPFTQEHRANMSANHKGMIGKTHSVKSKYKIGIAQKDKVKSKIECPHCHKIGGVPSMRRWHFENCGVNL